MTPEKIYNKNLEKGVTLEKCIKKADKYIKSKGFCLFIFDIKDSKKYLNRQELQNQIFNLTAELNTEFDEYFQKNKYVNGKEEKGFVTIIGDSSLACINNSEAITKISDYISQKMPSIQFYFDVARDAFDREALKLIRQIHDTPL